MYLLEIVSSFPLDKHPELELLDYMVHLFLIFWPISVLFCLLATPVYISTSSLQRFSFLHVLSNTCYFFNFGNSHSYRCQVTSYWGISLIVMLSTFSRTTCLPFVCHLWKMSIQLLRPFLNQIVFLSWSCMSSLYFGGINLLSDIWFGNILSHSVACLFILLIVSFVVQELFRLV